MIGFSYEPRSGMSVAYAAAAMKKKTSSVRLRRRPLPAVIALTVITTVHLGTAWAADGGIEDAGSDAAISESPDAGDDDEADGGVERTSCGAKKADRGNGMVLFGTGCC
jgi:hypothetical protein